MKKAWANERAKDCSSLKITFTLRPTKKHGQKKRSRGVVFIKITLELRPAKKRGQDDIHSVCLWIDKLRITAHKKARTRCVGGDSFSMISHQQRPAKIGHELAEACIEPNPDVLNAMACIATVALDSIDVTSDDVKQALELKGKRKRKDIDAAG